MFPVKYGQTFSHTQECFVFQACVTKALYSQHMLNSHSSHTLLLQHSGEVRDADCCQVRSGGDIGSRWFQLYLFPCAKLQKDFLSTTHISLKSWLYWLIKSFWCVSTNVHGEAALLLCFVLSSIPNSWNIWINREFWVCTRSAAVSFCLHNRPHRSPGFPRTCAGCWSLLFWPTWRHLTRCLWLLLVWVYCSLHSVLQRWVFLSLIHFSMWFEIWVNVWNFAADVPISVSSYSPLLCSCSSREHLSCCATTHKGQSALTVK